MDNPSKYQLAIFDYIKESNGHLVVDAVAGSGKTTTALESLKYVDKGKRVLFLAFNKSIANTLQARVPYSVKASTIHAQGFAVIKKLYPQAIMEEDKVYTTILDLSKENRWIIPREDRAAFLLRIEKIVNLMRLTLRSSYDDCEEICNRFDIDDLDGEIDYAKEVYDAVVRNKRQFDFTDMVFIPATEAFRMDGYDIVYVDEFQDCCEAQYVFIQKLLKADGRLIAIGDPRQSLYGYLGANSDIFYNAANRKNAKSLPLSISYRCGNEIVKHAQKIVPEIEARPNAHNGEVVMEGSVKNIKDGDVVLCRINFPLVQLCLQFIKEGKKAIVRGNDIGKNLISFLKPYQDGTVGDMEDGIEKKRINLIKKLIKKYPDRPLEGNMDYQNLMDKIQILNALSEDAILVSDVMAKINKIFSDNLGVGIILSTVHRFKGLEADNVFIIEPHLIPFPYYADQPWQIEQEKNIDYVARTRAVHKLEYVRDWTCFKKKQEIGKKKNILDLVVESNKET